MSCTVCHLPKTNTQPHRHLFTGTLLSERLCRAFIRRDALPSKLPPPLRDSDKYRIAGRSFSVFDNELSPHEADRFINALIRPSASRHSAREDKTNRALVTEPLVYKISLTPVSCIFRNIFFHSRRISSCFFPKTLPRSISANNHPPLYASFTTGAMKFHH